MRSCGGGVISRYLALDGLSMSPSLSPAAASGSWYLSQLCPGRPAGLYLYLGLVVSLPTQP